MLKPITLAACLSVAAFSAHADGAVKQGPALTAEEVRRELGGVGLGREAPLREEGHGRLALLVRQRLCGNQISIPRAIDATSSS